jgi:hypothetical protein
VPAYAPELNPDEGIWQPLKGGTLPAWLVRVLLTVIQMAMLPVFHTRQELSLGRPITLELIGDEHQDTYWHLLRCLPQNPQQPP